jgi:hypothetical protein
MTALQLTPNTLHCMQIVKWIHEYAGCDITLVGTPAAPSTPEIAAKNGHLNVVCVHHAYTVIQHTQTHTERERMFV